MNFTTDSATGADWMRPAHTVPESRFGRTGASASRLQASLSLATSRVLLAIQSTGHCHPQCVGANLGQQTFRLILWHLKDGLLWLWPMSMSTSLSVIVKVVVIVCPIVGP